MGNCLNCKEDEIRNEEKETQTEMENKEVNPVERGSMQLLEDSTLENTLSFSFEGEEFDAKVIDVYDGDTVTLAVNKFASGLFFNVKCRLFGIDSAEIRTKNKEEKKFGYEAKQFLSNLVLNKIVKVKCSKKKDKYGRAVLGTLFIDNTNVNQLLVDKGFAYEYFGDKKKEFDEWKA